MFVYKVSSGDHVTQKNITEYLDTCARHDVYNSSFLSYIVFLGSSQEDASVEGENIRFLDSERFGAWSFVTDDASKNTLAPGPYVLGRKMTWQPSRIYADTHDTMLTSFRPRYTPDRHVKTQPPHWI